MKLQRISRLLEIITLLQGGKGYNADGLAVECGVSRRTIFRDLDTLKQAGLPLEYDDASQRYHLPAAQFLPPTNFTTDEALALLVLCFELGEEASMPFYAPACSAALKLESTLPGPLREEVREVTGAIHINLQPRNPLSGRDSMYQRLVRAVTLRRCVRMTYDSVAESSHIQTKLSPYKLLFSGRSWYIIGRSSLHRQTRTFNVGRIQALEMLEDRYKIPRGFSIDRYLRNAWHLIPQHGPDSQVHLRFKPLVARNVSEVTWHKTQQTQWRDDGSLDFRVTVSGLWELHWWILGYGDQVEVLAPGKLREMVQARVKEMAKTYQGK